MGWGGVYANMDSRKNCGFGSEIFGSKFDMPLLIDRYEMIARTEVPPPLCSLHPTLTLTKTQSLKVLMLSHIRQAGPGQCSHRVPLHSPETDLY